MVGRIKLLSAEVKWILSAHNSGSRFQGSGSDPVVPETHKSALYTSRTSGAPALARAFFRVVANGILTRGERDEKLPQL
jgi:hypothetical protein